MLSTKLTRAEARLCRDLAIEVSRTYETVEDRDFIQHSYTLCHELPIKLRKDAYEFRNCEPASAWCVRCIDVDDRKLPPTPEHWSNKPVPSPTLIHDIQFFLIGALLGDAVGWSTQQDGYVMHDVFPIKNLEYEPLGAGSRLPLDWHTEDAFHPMRADYVALMCLRNPDRIPTWVGCMEDVSLCRDQVDALMRHPVYIKPDLSHLPDNGPQTSCAQEGNVELLESAYVRITAMNEQPPPTHTLFGSASQPYLCVDPYFTDEISDEAAEAYEALVAAMSASIVDVALEPGEIVFLDNMRAVHGRPGFCPRYDGLDRWLKRLNLVRDLRRSRVARLGPNSRVIY